MRDNEWMDYYGIFPYFTASGVRDGCHPRILQQNPSSDKAIVLVHGLSDSPYFMTAIAKHFFEELGYSVYMPLLHFHGLKEPKGMEGVRLSEWKRNVNEAVNAAASRHREVSIGGLSTGGALSLYAAIVNPKVSGSLYLFSAALDLTSKFGSFAGELSEKLLATFLVDILDKNEPLIGPNPYRYSHVDLDGAHELAELIREVEDMINQFSLKRPFSKRIFAAHSAFDTTANIEGVEKLLSVCNNQWDFFRIEDSHNVPHASVVLNESIFAAADTRRTTVLEPKNPLFDEMLRRITAFA